MKKIIFVVTTDLNYDQRMQRICGSLHKTGFQVTLVGREWNCSKPLRPQPYRQHRLRCFFKGGKLFYAEFTCRLWLFLLLRKYDAYCAIDLDTILPLWAKARLSGGRFGYDAHEYFPEVIEVTDRPRVKQVWEAIEAFMVPRTDYAYTVTSSLAQIFEKKYGRRFEVIRNVSPLQRFVEPLKAEKYVLYQGAVNEGRGLETLLLAMRGVHSRLVICGEGDLSEALREQTRALGIEEKVQFRGFLLPEQLLEVTRGAYVGVMLLENRGLSYYYSLANKFFDYIHAGIPQIAVDFPEYRALNEKYQVADLVPLEPDEISRSLNRLLLDKPYYEKLAANCEQAREELNWQQEEQKLLALYRQLWPQEQTNGANT
jgi:glycosyltransferase involved in cell wall biosynthesis